MCNKNEKISAPEANRKRVRNDILFISALLLVLLLAGLAIFLLRGEGDTVIVTVDGKRFAEYSLHENREVEIKNRDGYNLLVIQDGKAYVKTANCPDGICAAHRPIENEGESIVCLPNTVVVEIRLKGQDQPEVLS